MSFPSQTFVTITSLIKEDLPEAYYLPCAPSTYMKEEYRFMNDKRYRLFDPYPPSAAFLRNWPTKFLPAAGDAIPILLDVRPPSRLTEHWEMWLPPTFTNVIFKTIDQGLGDDVAIVTMAPLQSIAERKHYINPDDLYSVHIKSCIPKIGVPCPRHMDQTEVEYPCMVKVDFSWGGFGNRLAENETQLRTILHEIREQHGWEDKIVFQEVIQGLKEVVGYQFYLRKSGEIYWIGTRSSGGTDKYHWDYSVMDWRMQEQYKTLAWDRFTVPIATYLHQRGYFGFIEFELLVNDVGMYLVDLNPRVCGGTPHALMAPFFAQMGYNHSTDFGMSSNMSYNAIIEKGDDVNKENNMRVIILSARSVGSGCECYVSIYGRTHEDVHSLRTEFSCLTEDTSSSKKLDS